MGVDSGHVIHLISLLISIVNWIVCKLCKFMYSERKKQLLFDDVSGRMVLLTANVYTSIGYD